MLDPRTIQMMTHETNEDLMNPVEVYTPCFPLENAFKLITKCPDIETFRWFRRFSEVGRFMLTTEFSPKKMDIYAKGNVIYKRDVDEAAFIEGRRVLQTLNGEQRLIVEGRFISSLLDRRVATLTGDFQLPVALQNIISNNFLMDAGAARSMASLVRLMPMRITSGEVISIELNRRNTLDAIVSLIQDNGIGLRTRFNAKNRTLDIEFYEPTPSVAIFDKEFGNVLEQDYWDDTENFKNVVYVGDTFTYNNNITGFERREVFASEPTGGSTFLTQTARETLNRHRATTTLQSVIDAGSKQFEYLKDWNIGSRILSQNRDIGFSQHEVVTEILEFYDETGLNIEASTGSYISRGGAS